MCLTRVRELSDPQPALLADFVRLVRLKDNYNTETNNKKKRNKTT